MKNFDHVDFSKYSKEPIPNNVHEIREMIKDLRMQDKDDSLSPIEHQLIFDRIVECQDKIQELTGEQEVKITPVLRTLTVAQTKSMRKKPQFKLGEHTFRL